MHFLLPDIKQHYCRQYEYNTCDVGCAEPLTEKYNSHERRHHGLDRREYRSLAVLKSRQAVRVQKVRHEARDYARGDAESDISRRSESIRDEIMRVPDDHGTCTREQTRVEVYGVARVASLQSKPREDRVQRISDARADTEQQTLARDTDASHKSRDKAAAEESRDDGDDLDGCKFLFEKQRRQQRDHDRRNIKKDRSCGQAHHGDSRKVAECEEQKAQKPGA